MTPIKYTVKNNITHFHYKPSELINFVRLGIKDGNVGLIVVRRENDLLTYKGFGTIEHPMTTIHTMVLKHCPLFDGKMLTDDERLIPPKPFFTKENTKFIILDLGNKI